MSTPLLLKGFEAELFTGLEDGSHVGVAADVAREHTVDRTDTATSSTSPHRSGPTTRYRKLCCDPAAGCANGWLRGD